MLGALGRFRQQRLKDQHLYIGLILQTTLLGLTARQLNIVRVKADGCGRREATLHKCASLQHTVGSRLLKLIEQQMAIVKPPFRFFGFVREVRSFQLFTIASSLVSYCATSALDS